MLNRKLEDMPNYVKALLLDADGYLVSWNWGKLQTPINITYSFNPNNAKKSKFIPVNKRAISADYQELVRSAMQSWMQVTNVGFSEARLGEGVVIFAGSIFDSAFVTWDLNRYDLPLNSTSYAYNKVHTQTRMNFIINDALHNASFTWTGKLYTFMSLKHEVGHVLGLNHPFESSFIADLPKTTTMSILNYDVDELYQTPGLFGMQKASSRTVLTLTPSYYDIIAAQVLFRENPKWGQGNDIYQMQYFADEVDAIPPSNYGYYRLKPVFTMRTIFDNRGTNTLSAQHVNVPVTINLNEGPYYRSLINKHYIVLAGNFVNAIGGKDENHIILNQYNNRVDVRQAQKQVVIRSFASDMGVDTIIGFDVTKDKLCIEYHVELNQPQWQISPLQHETSLRIHNETIPITHGITIRFDDKNQIVLANVHSHEFDPGVISLQGVSEDQRLQREQLLTKVGMNHFFYNATSSCLLSAGLTSFSEASAYLLTSKLGYHSQHVKYAQNMLYLTASYLQGGWKSLVTSSYILGACEYLNISPQTARIIGFASNAALAYTLYDSTEEVATNFLVNASASVVGGFIGSKLAFFAKKGIDKVCDYYKHSKQEESHSHVTHQGSQYANKRK